jgi:hypothetical protein
LISQKWQTLAQKQNKKWQTFAKKTHSTHGKKKDLKKK